MGVIACAWLLRPLDTGIDNHYPDLQTVSYKPIFLISSQLLS